jgi:thioredoxin-dependent peroxiredoxin
MKIIFYSLLLLISFIGYRYFNSSAAGLKAGKAAPDFSLADETGTIRNLKDYAGSWLVLYFYPKDDTPGCTKEACHFRDNISKLKQLYAQVLGISVDDSQSHAAFSQKYTLSFPLLADKDGVVAKQYHALLDLGVTKVAKRYTYLINPEGVIAKIYLSVNPATHSQEIVDDLSKLQKMPALTND